MKPHVSEISRRRKLNLLRSIFPSGSSILEVGAGSGWFSGQLREAGYRVTTMDLEGEADIVGDINDWKSIGLEPGSFDNIVALEVIEHVDCLASLSALCREGGLIMLSSPHPNWDWVMKILEVFHLNQKRTSEHTNLTDFRTIPLEPVVMKRPMMIHQVAIFRNSPAGKSA